MGLKLGDLIWGAGILILVYLVVTNWKGSNTLLGTAFGGLNTTFKTLQGR